MLNEGQRVLSKTIIIRPPAFLSRLWLISALIPIIMIVAIGLSEFNRSVSVLGITEPAGGSVVVEAQARGVVTEYFVETGDAVIAGAPLLRVQSPFALTDQSAQSQQLQDATNLVSELERQLELQTFDQANEIDRLNIRLEALLANRGLLDEQIAAQRELISIGRERLERFEELSERGSLPISFVDDHRAQLIESSATLQILLRAASDADAEIAEINLSLSGIGNQHEAQRSRLRSDLIRAHQMLRDVDQAAGHVLSAPVAGEVLRLDLGVGDLVTSGDHLAMIAPTLSIYEIVVYLPSADIGEIATGQSARIRFSAFPAEQYGAISGSVATVAEASIGASRFDSNRSIASDFYRVVIEIDNDSNPDFPRDRLRIGMVAEVDITLNTRPAWHWIVYPNSR